MNSTVGVSNSVSQKREMAEPRDKTFVVTTRNEKEALQRQIAATDAQIDQLVYELYGLMDDEMKIVEDATERKG
jgi:predicted  nucleic acid-binding Zn-ribbon protein